MTDHVEISTDIADRWGQVEREVYTLGDALFEYRGELLNGTGGSTSAYRSLKRIRDTIDFIDEGVVLVMDLYNIGG